MLGPGSWADGPTGDNPPYGAAFYYYLKDKPKDGLTIEILDASGKHVRTLDSKAAEPSGSYDNIEKEKKALEKAALPADIGVRRAAWDLRCGSFKARER